MKSSRGLNMQQNNQQMYWKEKWKSVFKESAKLVSQDLSYSVTTLIGWVAKLTEASPIEYTLQSYYTVFVCVTLILRE